MAWSQSVADCSRPWSMVPIKGRSKDNVVRWARVGLILVSLMLHLALLCLVHYLGRPFGGRPGLCDLERFCILMFSMLSLSVFLRASFV
ncbi:uncharacterized protein F4817DRAFT_243357 [Daldinia loculata]|uniref:uncharacterized protein n=1 Tax=Daldinia loculata TaxID=103429 RepID=UPI0020C529FD|nr:uncharacterized protein F4817DRAFT_243357 [Daldinia loculata]KAI1643768.1 hypothetical protein F4817DRAFT_243357 [Daldinia loculata]